MNHEKYFIKRKDFAIINSLEEALLFYTPNSQLFSLSNSNLKEYFDICSGSKIIDSSFLNPDTIAEIYTFLNNTFKGSLPPLKIQKPTKNKIHLLILPISAHCNLRCSYCFASEGGKFAFDDLKSSKAVEVIDYLFQTQKLKNVEILFFGGEPFLNIDTMLFVINYITLKYKDKNVGYSVTTNGTIVNKRILKIIKQNKISVLVSIDGPKEYENHRIFPNGASSFDQTITTIRLLKENGVPLGLRATISNQNIRLVETYQFFESMGIPFNIVFAHNSENKNHGLSNYANSIELLKSQFKDLLRFYLNHIDNNQTINCLSITGKLKFLLFRTKNYHACSGGRSIFSITSDGELFTCEHLAGISKYSVGSIYSGIDKKKQATLQSVNVDRIEECKQCWVRYCCAGGCFAENVSTFGNTKQHDKSKCELIKLEYSFIFALYYEINKKYPNYFKSASPSVNEHLNC